MGSTKDSTYWLGTPEFFQLCKLIGADGYIAFNVRSTPSAGGGWQNMVDWLNYIDTSSQHPEWKSQLKYIKIGNEEWGGCGTGWQRAPYKDTTDLFLSKISPAWKSRFTIIMDGGQGGNWIDTNTRQEVGKVQGQSLHYYAVSNWTTKDCPSVGFTQAQYYQKINATNSIVGQIANWESKMLPSDPNYTMGLMIDEWGIWCSAMSGSLGGDYNQSTVMHAVATGLSLNAFNNHCRRVQMALSAQPVNTIHALFLTKPGRTDSSLIKGATFYVYKMMKVHQGAKMVPAKLTCGSVSSTPVLSASASVDSLNRLNITLVNINTDTTKTCTITLTNPPKPYQSIGAQIVTGPTDSSYNDFNKPEQVNIKPFADSNYTLSGSLLTVQIPPHAVVQFQLSPNATGVHAAGRVITPMSQLSAEALANGRIHIRYPAAQRTTIHWSLSSLDGRVIESSSAVMNAGQTGFFAEVKHAGLGSKVYLLRAEAAGASRALPLVFGR